MATTRHASSPAASDELDAIRARQVRQTELIISAVLRAGVLISGAVILLGTILFFARGTDLTTSDPRAVVFPHTVSSIMSSTLHGNALGIIMLGLLLLLATPMVRVAVSVLAFAVERDWRYVSITLIVLAILLASFFLLGGLTNIGG